MIMYVYPHTYVLIQSWLHVRKAQYVDIQNVPVFTDEVNIF